MVGEVVEEKALSVTKSKYHAVANDTTWIAWVEKWKKSELHTVLSKEAIFLPGRICLWQGQSYLPRQEWRVRLEVAGQDLICSPDAQPSDLLLWSQTTTAPLHC